MPQKKKLNDKFNPIIQALLDLEQSGIDTKELQKQLKNDTTALNKATKLFESHQYPDRVLRYVQLKNFRECRAIANLTSQKGGASARSVLIELVRIMNSDLLVTVSSEYLTKILNMSKPTILMAIKMLKNLGFIATYLPQQGRIATIFMINPKIAIVGKPINHEKQFRNLIETEYGNLVPLFKFQQLQQENDNITIGHIKAIKDGIPIKINTLIEFADKEKTASAVAATDTVDFPNSITI